MKESSIETYLKTQCEGRLIGFCLKFWPYLKGLPDRLVLLKGGVLIFVETKAPGKEASNLQKFWKGKFEGLGFRWELIDTKAKVDLFIENLIKCGHATKCTDIKDSESSI